MFLNYSIRKEDISLIEAICMKYLSNFDWVKEELLKEFNEKKIRNQEMIEKAVEKVIEKVLLKINRPW